MGTFINYATLLGGREDQRFVTKPFKSIGICRVLSYEGRGAVQNLGKSRYVLYGRPLIRYYTADFFENA
jgi:hypothetical protein